MKKTAILAALALMGAAPAPAQPAPSVSVAYADLDLSDPRDAARMLKRIRHAAVEACRQGFAGHDADAVIAFEACRRDAVERAVQGLNAPRVSQAYAAKAPTTRLSRLP